MTVDPQIGDMWLFTGDGVIYILIERLPSLWHLNCKFRSLNLMTGSFEEIVFAPPGQYHPGNIDRWSKLA